MPDPSNLREYSLTVENVYYTENRLTHYVNKRNLHVSSDCQTVEHVDKEYITVWGLDRTCSLNVPRRTAKGACTDGEFPPKGNRTYKDPYLKDAGRSSVAGHECKRMTAQRGTTRLVRCFLERNDPWLVTKTPEANRLLTVYGLLEDDNGAHKEWTATLIELDVLIPWSVSMPQLARGYSLSDPIAEDKRR